MPLRTGAAFSVAVSLMMAVGVFSGCGNDGTSGDATGSSSESPAPVAPATGEPTPTPSAALVANEKPVHTSDVSPASVGRSDCPADWLAAKSQSTGFSICYPADWGYFARANERRLHDGSSYWDDEVTILLPGKDRIRAEVYVGYLAPGQGYYFAECSEPEPVMFLEISGTVCSWGDQGEPIDDFVTRGTIRATGYYLPVDRGRWSLGIALDGYEGGEVAEGDPGSVSESDAAAAQQILETLRFGD